MALHHERKKWAEAKATCEAEGAELIKSDRDDINDWIKEQNEDEVFIGANDRVKRLR